MDIAMIFDGLQVGGIEKVGASYCRLLVEMGHRVTVVNLRPDLTEFEGEFPPECVIEHFMFPRYRAPEARAGLIQNGYAGKLSYPLRYTAASLRNVLSRPLCRRRCPSLRRSFDLAIAFAGHFNDLTFVAHGFVRARAAVCWLHGALYQYFISSAGYLELYQKIGNLVVLVDDAQEEVLAYHPELRLNIRKMYNPTFISGEDADPAHVVELRARYGRYLLMAARFSYPHKDHYTVADAFRLLRERYHDDLELVFAGDGPEEQKVRDHIAAWGSDAASHVHFVGARHDMQDYYSAAHILVHASVAGEGLPTVMLEALSFGLPMVVTDSKVGPREILRDNEYGLLCRVSDPEDMAEKIHRLHRDEDLYRTYSDKSEQRLRDFRPDVIRRQLAEMLDELCGS